MSTSPEIVLPPDLTWLTVEEIPGVIAAALHPAARDDALVASLAVATTDEERQQCTDSHMAAALACVLAETDHAKALERTIHAGELQTYSPGMAPLDPIDGATVFARIRVPDFIGYVDRFIPELTVRILEPPTAPSAASKIGMEWIRAARAEGKKIQASKPKLSLEKIAHHVHEKFKADRITGRGGRVPSWQTIKRHALKGIKK